MPELRQNIVTKDWVIIATERAKRPEELSVKRETKPLPSYAPNCPFCPGNENLAPPEVMRLPEGNGRPWQVRIVPNKFSAVAREGEPVRRFLRSHRTVEAVGHHDVIIETPDHALTTALLSDEQVLSILKIYKRRFIEVSNDPRVAHVIIFKNHGVGAGTSLEHPHSQLIATPVVSNQVNSRLNEALRHYHDFGECIYCELLWEELEEQSRVAMESTHFVALQPFASASPFATHIYPRRHMATFDAISDEELADLAHVLRTVLAKLYVGLQNPDFNYSIRTAPAENSGVKYYHWYLSLIPRLTRVAGFELGSGMFINTVLPEAAAEFLRNTQVERISAASD